MRLDSGCARAYADEVAALKICLELLLGLNQGREVRDGSCQSSVNRKSFQRHFVVKELAHLKSAIIQSD